jgi:hypothetical protein
MIMVMKRLFKKIKILLYIAYAGLAFVAFTPQVHAIPFGQGTFGHDLFGSATSLSVALSGNVNLNLTSNGSQFTGSGSHTITVSSTDVIGYSLYAYASNGNTMTASGGATIPASANSTAGPLAVNTWGYNIDGSGNYLGMGTTPTLVKTAAGEYRSGDTTTVTYGVLTNSIQQPGSYSVSVVYTAVCLSQ